MPRESTVKFEFELEKIPATAATPFTLSGAGITKSAAAGDPTQIHLDTAALPASAPKVGDLLMITGSGLSTLDGEVHRVTAYTAGTGLLEIGTDTFADTGTVNTTIADIHVAPMAWDHVCLTDFSPSPGTPGEVDATTMCDEERVMLPGLPSAGTASFTMPFNMDDAGWQAMRAAYKDGKPRWFIGKTRRGQMALFHGVVSAFTIGQLAVEQLVTTTGNFTLDRSPSYMKAA